MSLSFPVPLFSLVPALRCIAVTLHQAVTLLLTLYTFACLVVVWWNIHLSFLLKLLAREYKAQWASWSPRCHSFCLFQVFCHLARCGSHARLRERELFPRVPLQPPLSLGENSFPQPFIKLVLSSNVLLKISAFPKELSDRHFWHWTPNSVPKSRWNKD